MFGIILVLKFVGENDGKGFLGEVGLKTDVVLSFFLNFGQLITSLYVIAEFASNMEP